MSTNYEILQFFFEKFNFIYLLWSLAIIVLFAYLNNKGFFVSKKHTSSKNSNKSSSINKNESHIINNLKTDDSNYIWLNNYLLWIYFNEENTKKFNNFILKSLNNSVINFI